MTILQGLPDLHGRADAAAEKESSKALETMLLKNMITASGAFKGSNAAGSALHADLFVEALAEAVVNSGGLGLAAQIESSLHPQGSAPTMVNNVALAGSLPAAPLSAAHSHITSAFGVRTDPIHGELRQHNGVDFGAAEGTPIVASQAGTVISAGPRGGYGNAVEIDHGGGVTTLYAHASEITVAPGTRVEAGQPIGTVGHTGRATGDHLHFEFRVRGIPTNPTRALQNYANRAEKKTEGR